MALYHLLLDCAAFRERIRPALAESWRRRSFEPCRCLCADLTPAALAFQQRYHTRPDEPLVCRVAAGLPFDRAFWRYLVGEILWLSATEIPEIQTTPDALGCLLGADRTALEGLLGREHYAPIQQAYFGARELTFATACYRPGQAGYNDSADVARLHDYLAALDPAAWKAETLAGLPGMEDEEERAEELAFVREWFPTFLDLYRRAREAGQVVVCEIL
jgi:hypothetical protein